MSGWLCRFAPHNFRVIKKVIDSIGGREVVTARCKRCKVTVSYAQTY
jgi:hypothetical protein